MNAKRLLTQSSVVALVGLLCALPAAAGPVTLAPEPVTLAPGPVAYWNFDEGSGSVLHDVTGHGYDGTIYGADWVHGVMGNALGFKDTTDGVRYISSSFDDSVSTGLTIAAWVRSYDGTGEDRIIFDGRGSGAGSCLAVRPDNSFAFYIYRPGASQGVIGSGPGINWTHVAAVFDDAANKMHLFTNGVEAVGSPVDAPYPYYRTSLSAAIGNNLWAPGDGQWRKFNGCIDELLFYDRPLSATEVWNVYMTTPEPASLVHLAAGALILFRGRR